MAQPVGQLWVAWPPPPAPLQPGGLTGLTGHSALKTTAADKKSLVPCELLSPTSAHLTFQTSAAQSASAREEGGAEGKAGGHGFSMESGQSGISAPAP